MEKKPGVKCETFSWRTEDFAEYCKLPSILHDGITGEQLFFGGIFQFLKFFPVVFMSKYSK